jgi:surface polysaccharide O-acyltransferase-like enzyme
MIPWSFAVVIALYALGSAWARRTPTGRLSQRTESALQKLSQASFGIYLLHPLLLNPLSQHGFGLPHSFLPPPWSTIVLVVVAGGASYLIVEILARTPLSLPLTGRPRRHDTEKMVTSVPAVAPVT